MNFKHSAFIENSREMRERLEGLGYKRFSDADGDTLCTMHDGGYHLKNYNLGKTRFQVYLDMINPIDCQNNPDLFKAITAMRDDDEMNQFFVADANIMYHIAFPDGEPFFGDIDMGEFFLMDKAMSCADYMGCDNSAELVHRATLEELIKHFKK